MAIMAAERLHVPVERVEVSTPDTDVTPYDQQTSSSRSTHSMGAAVVGAADEIRKQLLDLAAEAARGGRRRPRARRRQRSRRGLARSHRSRYGDLVRRSRSGNLLGTYTFKTVGRPRSGDGPGHRLRALAPGRRRGRGRGRPRDRASVDVLRYHAGVYAGRIINPVQAELQTEGNVAFGVGQALFEEMVFDEGQLQNGNLGDYMIASIEDLPRGRRSTSWSTSRRTRSTASASRRCRRCRRRSATPSIAPPASGSPICRSRPRRSCAACASSGPRARPTGQPGAGPDGRLSMTLDARQEAGMPAQSRRRPKLTLR